jgi:hypothetical protein
MEGSPYRGTTITKARAATAVTMVRRARVLLLFTSIIPEQQKKKKLAVMRWGEGVYIRDSKTSLASW